MSSSFGKMVLKGRTGIPAFDCKKRKPARTPASFFDKLKERYGD